MSTRATPAVSIVMIFLDEERFLAEAIESVLAQTDVDWELLLIDDGSTDRSPIIAGGYASRHPDRIRCLAHPDRVNRGMSASRNLGIDAASGQWLTFLDADDVWLRGKLARQLELLGQHPSAAVLVSPARWWYGWDEPNGDQQDWDQVLVPDGGEAAVVEAPHLLTSFLEDEWNSICDLVIDTDLARALGGYETPFTGMFEDQVFHAKVFANQSTVVSTDVGYLYRQHSLACTATAHAGGGHRQARARFLTWLSEHLASTRPDDVELRRLVERQRRPLRHPQVYRVLARARRLAELAGR